MTQDDEDERRRRKQLFAQRELDERLEATNVRRRAHGLPERTRGQAQREFGPDPASGKLIAASRGVAKRGDFSWPVA